MKRLDDARKALIQTQRSLEARESDVAILRVQVEQWKGAIQILEQIEADEAATKEQENTYAHSDSQSKGHKPSGDRKQGRDTN